MQSIANHGLSDLQPESFPSGRGDRIVLATAGTPCRDVGEQGPDQRGDAHTDDRRAIVAR